MKHKSLLKEGGKNRPGDAVGILETGALLRGREKKRIAEVRNQNVSPRGGKRFVKKKLSGKRTAD